MKIDHLALVRSPPKRDGEGVLSVFMANSATITVMAHSGTAR